MIDFSKLINNNPQKKKREDSKDSLISDAQEEQKFMSASRKNLQRRESTGQAGRKNLHRQSMKKSSQKEDSGQKPHHLFISTYRGDTLPLLQLLKNENGLGQMLQMRGLAHTVQLKILKPRYFWRYMIDTEYYFDSIHKHTEQKKMHPMNAKAISKADFFRGSTHQNVFDAPTQQPKSFQDYIQNELDSIMENPSDIFDLITVKTHMWNPILFAGLYDQYALIDQVTKFCKGGSCLQFFVMGSPFLNEYQETTNSYVDEQILLDVHGDETRENLYIAQFLRHILPFQLALDHLSLEMLKILVTEPTLHSHINVNHLSYMVQYTLRAHMVDFFKVIMCSDMFKKLSKSGDSLKLISKMLSIDQVILADIYDTVANKLQGLLKYQFVEQVLNFAIRDTEWVVECTLHIQDTLGKLENKIKLIQDIQIEPKKKLQQKQIKIYAKIERYLNTYCDLLNLMIGDANERVSIDEVGSHITKEMVTSSFFTQSTNDVDSYKHSITSLKFNHNLMQIIDQRMMVEYVNNDKDPIYDIVAEIMSPKSTHQSIIKTIKDVYPDTLRQSLDSRLDDMFVPSIVQMLQAKTEQKINVLYTFLKQRLSNTTLSQFEEFKEFDPQPDEVVCQSSDLLEPQQIMTHKKGLKSQIPGVQQQPASFIPQIQQKPQLLKALQSLTLLQFIIIFTDGILETVLQQCAYQMIARDQCWVILNDKVNRSSRTSECQVESEDSDWPNNLSSDSPSEADESVQKREGREKMSTVQVLREVIVFGETVDAELDIDVIREKMIGEERRVSVIQCLIKMNEWQKLARLMEDQSHIFRVDDAFDIFEGVIKLQDGQKNETIKELFGTLLSMPTSQQLFSQMSHQCRFKFMNEVIFRNIAQQIDNKMVKNRLFKHPEITSILKSDPYSVYAFIAYYQRGDLIQAIQCLKMMDKEKDISQNLDINTDLDVLSQKIEAFHQQEEIDSATAAELEGLQYVRKHLNNFVEQVNIELLVKGHSFKVAVKQ